MARIRWVASWPHIITKSRIQPFSATFLNSLDLYCCRWMFDFDVIWSYLSLAGEAKELEQFHCFHFSCAYYRLAQVACSNLGVDHQSLAMSFGLLVRLGSSAHGEATAFWSGGTGRWSLVLIVIGSSVFLGQKRKTLEAKHSNNAQSKDQRRLLHKQCWSNYFLLTPWTQLILRASKDRQKKKQGNELSEPSMLMPEQHKPPWSMKLQNFISKETCENLPFPHIFSLWCLNVFDVFGWLSS